MSLTKYKAMSEELSLRLQNEAKEKVLSYSEMINTIQKLPRTPDTDRIIIYFIDRIEDINGTGGYITVNLPKDIYLEIEKIREHRKFK